MVACSFSIFDPMGSGFSLNWLSMIFSLVFLSLTKWNSYSRMGSLLMLIYLKMYTQLKDVLGEIKAVSTIHLFITLFCVIVSFNYMGLMPYLFPSTSHLIPPMLFSFSMWMSFQFYGFFHSFKKSVAHMVPSDTPKELMFFMVIIESVSMMIRPFTLTVRLTANMIAGHLLLNYIGNLVLVSSLSDGILTSMGYSLLIILETAVALIQGYVMTVLLLLYMSDISY